ncbi:MAG: sulfatase-like hydrolase/transferase, partial [Arenibacter latericius]|nr:sulfatase-like hydrolase/transferase [Arenibacter latericius]
MKIHSILIVMATLLVGCKSINPKIANESKPNIIVILIDDAGYVDFGFMGSKDLETPYIDKLARNGVVFTDAHVTSTVCAPSRAGLISGKYQQRFGFEANGTGSKESGEIGLAGDVVTIAEVFQQNN